MGTLSSSEIRMTALVIASNAEINTILAKIPTAQGVIQGNFNNFEGHWIVDGHSIQFRGNFSQSVEQFQSGNATLEYDTIEDLVGSYVIDTAQTPSHVGNSDVVLSLANHAGKKVKITGSLSFPISERSTLTGQGIWIIQHD